MTDHPRGDGAHLGAILNSIERVMDQAGVPIEEPAKFPGVDPIVCRNQATVVRVERLAKECRESRMDLIVVGWLVFELWIKRDEK